MGWSIGDDNGRDIGYGVPALCDYPNCNEEIHRGLSYVCGEAPYGGEHGCGLFFCYDHQEYKDLDDDGNKSVRVCERCLEGKESFEPKPDIPEWINHKLTDSSWQQWRDENREEVRKLEKEYGLKAKGIETRQTF